MTAQSVCAQQEAVPQINEELLSRVGPQKFNAWFKHGTRLKLEDGCLEVAVPNPFVANWIEQHYRQVLLDICEKVLSFPVMLVFSVESELSEKCTKRSLDSQAEMVSRATQGRSRPRHSSRLPGPQLRHSLDDFVVGESNNLAYSAAMSVVDGVMQGKNQLFVHGSCGVGKTHLLQGICDLLGRKEGKLKCRYVTGEQFTNEYISMMRKGKNEEFRSRFRKLDLLAVDDVHFLAAKRATQEEFLHTFDAIECAGKRIILASDTHPRLVGDLNPQLVSRFLAGMTIKMEHPDKETRMEILYRKIGAMKVNVPEEVVEYICMHVRGSVREIEGILMKLYAVSRLENGHVTLQIARDVLADYLVQVDDAVTIGGIEGSVAPFFGVTPADIHSSRRTKTVSSARMTAMFLARKYTGMSFPEIGRFMGKNHSSVVLAVSRMEKLLAKDGKLEWVTPAGPRSMRAAQVLELLEEQIG